MVSAVSRRRGHTAPGADTAGGSQAFTARRCKQALWWLQVTASGGVPGNALPPPAPPGHPPRAPAAPTPAAPTRPAAGTDPRPQSPRALVASRHPADLISRGTVKTAVLSTSVAWGSPEASGVSCVRDGKLKTEAWRHQRPPWRTVPPAPPKSPPTMRPHPSLPCFSPQILSRVGRGSRMALVERAPQKEEKGRFLCSGATGDRAGREAGRTEWAGQTAAQGLTSGSGKAWTGSLQNLGRKRAGVTRAGQCLCY